MAQSVKHKTISGIVWSSVERFSTQGVQFVFSLIIARQLMPSDYGIIGMLSIFMALAQSFIDSGFSNALIQKQKPTKEDCSTVFYFNVIVGVLFYLLMYALAPTIADFYHLSLLTEITIWVSLNFVINSFTTVQSALLTIKLDFKRLAWISVLSLLISGSVAIWMAYNGYGVWTLVWQSLVAAMSRAVLLWISSNWFPSLVFSMQSFRELFGFGSKLLMGGLVHTIYQNLYTLLIGRFFSAADLGLYTRANTLSHYPSSLMETIVTRVTYPVECSLKDNIIKLEEKFFLFVRLTVFIVFPIMIGLCVLAEPLVRLLLTEKWLEAVPFIQILCFLYMLGPVLRMNWDLLNALHRSDLSLKAEFIKKVIAFAILFVTLPFGVKVMCYGQVFYGICDLIVITYFTRKLLPNVTLTREICILLPIFLLSLFTGVTIGLLEYLVKSDLLLIIGSVFLSALIYVTLNIVFKTQELKDLYNLLIKSKFQNVF